MHTIMSNTLLKFILVVSISLVSNTNGFTIVMIPINSPDVDILPSNLSIVDENELLANITMLRALSYQNRSHRVRPNAIEGLTSTLQSSYYITQLTLGNYANRGGKYQPLLLLDTGSEETWFQCEGCNPCFPIQNSANYPLSRSFTRMPSFDPLCVPRREYQGSCGFELNYTSGAHVEGSVGRDEFYFMNSNTHNMERYPDIAFGCGLKNENVYFVGNKTTNMSQNTIAGVYGLGRGPRSFLTQMSDAINGRFSYCLPPFSNIGESRGRTTIMHFGPDAQISGDASHDVRTISMSNTGRYHLYLSGITVAGDRLDIDYSYCKLGHNSGFFIDVGAPYSALPRREYFVLTQAMVRYFHQYNWTLDSTRQNNLCYNNYPDDVQDQSFPAVTFHFLLHGSGEIDMDLPAENMFEVMQNNTGFCMAVMVMDDGPCIFGNFQQKNIRFLFDINHATLSFVPTDCVLNRN